jgi:hypothetical protein
VTDASIYMQMPDDTYPLHAEVWCESRGESNLAICDSDAQTQERMGSGQGPDLEPFCRPEFRVRLLKYDKKAAQSNLKPGSKPKAARWANLMQTAEFAYNDSDLAPTLLKDSWLFDLISLQEVLPIQHLLVQGFLVPGLVPPEWSQHFPFPSLVSMSAKKADAEMLSEGDVRRLAGNSFHWSAVGATLMFAWGASRIAQPVRDE